MNEISLQAVPFFPRFISMISLVSLTWLVAKFAQYMVLRAASQCRSNQNAEGFSKIVATLSFWTVILLISPLILKAAGLNAAWLWKVQAVINQFFVNWPIWMIVSLLMAGISYLMLNVPKFYLQLKASLNTSQKEPHS